MQSTACNLERPMRPSPQLACLRRRLLRRALAEAGLCPGEVAVAIGVDPDYLAKLVAGSRPITDAMCWRLWVCYQVPFAELERHNCPDLS
jgi:hypothetical protein